MKRKLCNETIEFGDDEGDNTCTFHCQLPFNHIGQHEETGNQYNKKYRLVWEDLPDTRKSKGEMNLILK